MKKIQQKINEHYKKQLPFVVYNKPNAKKVFGVFQQNDDLNIITNQFDRQGFIFAPFSSNDISVLFPLSVSELMNDNLPVNDEPKVNGVLSKNFDSKFAHVELVENGVEAIERGCFKKVVLSRKEKVKLAEIDVIKTYDKLLYTYPNAFVYVWFHPKVGLWFGATPETLLQTSSQKFKTMSLAGTQVFKEGVELVWKNKELEEQQLVTDFIKNQLNPIASNLIIDKTETIKAGNLLHLRTKVEGVLNKNASLEHLIRGLHPTPAVCGLPKERAKEFINVNENYKRTFYTGFLGELGVESSHLYVNLRCMGIADQTASIYVGGGITKESNPKKEWEETVSKSKTMRRVL